MSDTTTAQPSAALEAFQQGDLDPATARHLAAQWREAQRLAVTSVVPRSITHVRRQVNGTWQTVEQPLEVVKATVFAVVRYGEIFGFPAAVALNKIDVVEGRLEPRYDALAGLMMDAGHQVRYRESSSERCTIAVRRREDISDPDGWQTITYTIDDAKAAGLVKEQPSDSERKGAWYLHRGDMLVSKAVKRACRRFTPDVLIRSDDVDLIEGASIEQMVGPARSAGLQDLDGGGVSDREAEAGDAGTPVTATSTVDTDDEPVDGEIVDDPEQRAKAQRGLMAQATKTPA